LAEVLLPYSPRKAFLPFHDRTKRWGCLVAHRRAGKTVAAVNDIIRAAVMYTGPNGLFGYVAPYQNQARRIAWDYFKHYAQPLISDTNEQMMTLTLVNGAKIGLFGADNADAMRGLGFSGLYLDEYGDFKPSVFGSVLRAALADKGGWCVFAGTPKGRNQFYDIYQIAQRLPDEWFLLRLPASESGLLPQSELNAAKAQLLEDQYLQEFECSFQASILGAFFGKEMREAEPRINERVVYEPGYPVHTAFDLGYRDDTAIWWYQVVGNEVRVIDFYAVSGADIHTIAKVVVNKGYTYGKHYLPHDARAKSLQTGRSIVEQLADHLGIGNLSVVPNIGLQDGIQAVRQMLPRTWFNSVRCGDGVEALRQYQREYDEDKKAFRASPRHDWTSHPADAFRMLAVAWRQEPAAQKPLDSKVLIVGPQNQVTLNDMWQVHDRSVSRRARI
jgi:phage terminase large subunit